MPASRIKQPPFLPMTRAECAALGWDALDVIIITGDAYVDHPSFGAALIGRTLVDAGCRTGIIAQPRWKTDEDFLSLGAPRLFFGITAGNMDSMVNHYTARKKIRSDDAYSPGGVAGSRPDRASLIYAQHVKRLFRGVPVVLGGIEASMRRIPHYDYWSDTVRNSLLLDAKADILVYGMGEKQIRAIARRLDAGEPPGALNDIPGTVCASKAADAQPQVMLAPLDECRAPDGFHAMSRAFDANYRVKTVYQPFAGRFLKHNPPAEPLTQDELDRVYGLPYARAPHPRYAGSEIPAFTQIQTSVTAHRGCFGGCHFCTLGYHQGKAIQSRSTASILNEIRTIARQPGFKGSISDVGGPTANMYGMSCRRGIERSCPRRSCLYPSICPNLDTSHQPAKALLAACRAMAGVKHVFVSSGVRYDLALEDDGYIRDLSDNYVSGYLKVAPEHISRGTLRLMHKPPFRLYEQFVERFERHSAQAGRRQHVIPYLIVGHPGTRMQDAIELHQYLKRNDIRLEQVQEFTPTPMSISTCMYYTGRDFDSGDPIHVPKGRELRLQKALVLWWAPENRKLVVEAYKAGDR